MKEIIKSIPITTLLLTYLFMCGVLYLIGFWGTFNIDAFNLISVYDIPKSFVFPFIISQALFFANFMIGSITSFEDDRKERRFFVTINEDISLLKKLFIVMFTSIRLWVLYIFTFSFIFISDPMHNTLYWVLVSMTTAYYLLHQFVNIQEYKDLIKLRTLRTYIAHILIFFPISCFSTGKISSLRIYNNKEIKRIKMYNATNSPAASDTTSFKFLGFISDNFVYSTLDNKKTYILNKNSVDGIILE